MDMERSEARRSAYDMDAPVIIRLIFGIYSDFETMLAGRVVVNRDQRISAGIRLTVMTGTSNSSVSTNATRPSGPNASGMWGSSGVPSASVPT